MWKPIANYFTSWCQVIFLACRLSCIHQICLALEEDSFLTVQDVSCQHIEVRFSFFRMKWFLKSSHVLRTEAAFQKFHLLVCGPSLLPPSPPPALYPTLPQCLAGTGAWQRVNTAVKLHSPRYPVFDLQEGQRYQFRVSSVNVHGSSEPSVPSEPIQKVDQDGKTSGGLDP